MTSGRTGEEIASRLYRKKGYKILARNYLVKGGELDIVAYRFGTLVFSEVKTRSGDFFGTPREAVDEEKIFHLQTAAKQFLYQHRKGNKIPVWSPLLRKSVYRRIRNIRGDIVAVYLNASRREATVYKDAFPVCEK